MQSSTVASGETLVPPSQTAQLAGTRRVEESAQCAGAVLPEVCRQLWAWRDFP